MVTGSSLVFALFLQPLYGALSDRIGRKPLLIWFGVMGTIGTIPLLYSLQAAKTAIMAFLLIAAAWMIVAGYTHGSSLRQDRPRTHRGRSKDTAEGDGFRTVTSLGMEFTGKYDGLPYPLRGRRVSTTLRHSDTEFREYFRLSFVVC
jgi:MFS family permease